MVALGRNCQCCRYLCTNVPQFLYNIIIVNENIITYNNTREKPTNLRSNGNYVPCLTNVHVKSVRNLKEVSNLKRYNNFDKLIRVTCFVYRFIFNCKRKINKEKHLRIGCLKNEEIEYSQVSWLITEQRNIINNNKIMTDLRGNLNVFIDDDGILRVKGRLENSLLSYSCKYSILLNRDSYSTELIILKCHLFVLHSGVKDTLNELRRNY